MAVITIHGEITAETTAKVKNAIDNNFNHPKCLGISYRELFIDSSGGSVDEAMQIGHLLRENEFVVSVRKPDRCFSSCVLILASGIRRNAFGRIGIHRPYLEYLANGKTIEEIRKIRIQINSRISRYLDAMEVSQKLLDDMMSIEPERIKVLSLAELENYRLTGQPMSVDERNTVILAYIFGLKSAEFRERSAQADNICEDKYPLLENKFTETANSRRICWIATILGVSETIARNKDVNADTYCVKFPRFPVSKSQKFFDCKRNIYLN